MEASEKTKELAREARKKFNVITPDGIVDFVQKATRYECAEQMEKIIRDHFAERLWCTNCQANHIPRGHLTYDDAMRLAAKLREAPKP